MLPFPTSPVSPNAGEFHHVRDKVVTKTPGALCPPAVDLAVLRVRFYDRCHTSATLLQAVEKSRRRFRSASGTLRSARRSTATRIFLLICSSERRHGLMPTLTKRRDRVIQGFPMIHLSAKSEPAQRGIRGKSRSDSPGLIALSGTDTLRSHAEKLREWFRVEARVLNKLAHTKGVRLSAGLPGSPCGVLGMSGRSAPATVWACPRRSLPCLSHLRRATSLPVATNETSVDAPPQMARVSTKRRSRYDTG